MAEESSTAFSQEQFDTIYPPGVEHHYWNRCRNKVIAHELARSGAEGPMLEVGCGKGLVVRYLRSLGHVISGVELAPVAPLPEMMTHVRTGTDVFALEPSLLNSIRTILLLDVIEHLERPAVFLADLRAAMPALQHVLVTVPAGQDLFSNFDRFNGHFRRYDRPILSEHLNDAGFTGIQSRYFFHLLYPSARALLNFRGERPVRFTVPTGLLARLAHGLVGMALFAEYRLLPTHWRGTSLIALARVPEVDGSTLS